MPAVPLIPAYVSAYLLKHALPSKAGQVGSLLDVMNCSASRMRAVCVETGRGCQNLLWSVFLNFQDVVEVIEGSMEDVTLPEKGRNIMLFLL